MTPESSDHTNKAGFPHEGIFGRFLANLERYDSRNHSQVLQTAYYVTVSL